jgi:hypothetical protein
MFGFPAKPHLNGNAASLDLFAEQFRQNNIKLRSKAKKICSDVSTCVVTLHNIAKPKETTNGQPNPSTDIE